MRANRLSFVKSREATSGKVGGQRCGIGVFIRRDVGAEEKMRFSENWDNVRYCIEFYLEADRKYGLPCL